MARSNSHDGAPTTEYPGLPRTAVAYWEAYAGVLVSVSVLFGLTGSALVLALLELYPAAVPMMGIAVVSLVFHLAVLYVKDVWAGEYNPDQTHVASSRSLFALLLIAVAFAAVFIALGTLAGTTAAAVVDLPYAAAFVATYYPVLDLLGLRRGLWTPGSLVLASVVFVLTSVLDVQQPMVESLPVIGTRQRQHL
ncbi:hypothetical protein [Halovivax cerinus]|uniref:Tripartite tricarboxylate transporter TctB family n=1 Tax=Halovivax cerinus TaxID=1487865 RepID=A0ABD5NLG1_9EURY|nr:hypothetical protein [Halovivax cerinus]